MPEYHEARPLSLGAVIAAHGCNLCSSIRVNQRKKVVLSRLLKLAETRLGLVCVCLRNDIVIDQDPLDVAEGFRDRVNGVRTWLVAWVPS